MAVHDLQWRSRKLILEVHGIPEKEDFVAKLNGVAKKVGWAHSTLNDLDAIHRLLCKPGTVPGIIGRSNNEHEIPGWGGAKS